jgi:hypothetical protein
MLLYVLTIAHLDRDGLIDGTPAALAARVAPLRAELRDSAGAYINEWVDQGLVVRYQGERGRPVLFFKGFRRYQTNLDYARERASRYPPPPGYSRGKYGLLPEDSDDCFRCAEGLQVNSHYRAELCAAAQGRECSGMTPGVLRDDSGSSPGVLRDQLPPIKSNQINIGGGGVLDQQTDPSPPRYGNGGVWGGALGRLTRQQLIAVAVEVGAQLNFDREWRGWRQDLARADDERLRYVIAWTWYVCQMDLDELQSLTNVVAFVRARAGFKRGAEAVAPPMLSGQEMQELSKVVARVV